MREIIFRGKTLTGRWVEGAYYKQEEFYGDKEDAHIIITSKETLDNDYALERYVVIHETVGQYTGLTDKNGKKIFEGDIVQAYFRNNHSKQIFCVVFNDGMFLFDNNCVSVPKYDIYAMAVIGNIHDNPELLKGGG